MQKKNEHMVFKTRSATNWPSNIGQCFTFVHASFLPVFLTKSSMLADQKGEKEILKARKPGQNIKDLDPL